MIIIKSSTYYLKLFLIIAIAAMFPLTGSNPISVPLDNRVYEFLDRMESMGVVDNLVDGIKPLDRAYIAKILQKLDKMRDRLTQIDQDHLDNFLLDFRYDINSGNRYHLFNEDRSWYTPFASWKQFKSDFKRVLLQNHPEEDNHVVAWEDSTNSFYLDYILQLEFLARFNILLVCVILLLL